MIYCEQGSKRSQNKRRFKMTTPTLTPTSEQDSADKAAKWIKKMFFPILLVLVLVYAAGTVWLSLREAGSAPGRFVGGHLGAATPTPQQKAQPVPNQDHSPIYCHKDPGGKGYWTGQGERKTHFFKKGPAITNPDFSDWEAYESIDGYIRWYKMTNGECTSIRAK